MLFRSEHVFSDEEIILDNDSHDVLDKYMMHCKAVKKLEEIEQSRLRAQSRCAIIKEGIMIKVWHPSRVLRLLELGYEIEDM